MGRGRSAFGRRRRTLLEEASQLGSSRFRQRLVEESRAGLLGDVELVEDGAASAAEAGIGDLEVDASVQGVEPWDPVVTTHAPSITVTLGETDARLAEMACFVSGQGRGEIDWEEPYRRFTVGANKPFGHGRHRVNCTAPQHIEGLIARIAKTLPEMPILVYPNSGESFDAVSKTWSGTTTAEDWTASADKWRAAGARIVGGCCRTTPEHIGALRKAAS